MQRRQRRQRRQRWWQRGRRRQGCTDGGSDPSTGHGNARSDSAWRAERGRRFRCRRQQVPARRVARPSSHGGHPLHLLLERRYVEFRPPLIARLLYVLRRTPRAPSPSRLDQSQAESYAYNEIVSLPRCLVTISTTEMLTRPEAAAAAATTAVQVQVANIQQG